MSVNVTASLLLPATFIISLSYSRMTNINLSTTEIINVPFYMMRTGSPLFDDQLMFGQFHSEENWREARRESEPQWRPGGDEPEPKQRGDRAKE